MVMDLSCRGTCGEGVGVSEMGGRIWVDGSGEAGQWGLLVSAELRAIVELFVRIKVTLVPGLLCLGKVK